MAGAMGEPDRVKRRSGVEIPSVRVARFREIELVVAHGPHPRARGPSLAEVADPLADRCYGIDAVPGREPKGDEALGIRVDMAMGIDETGNHGLPAAIYRPCPPGSGSVKTAPRGDVRDPFSSNGDEPGPGHGGIHGDYVGIEKHEIIHTNLQRGRTFSYDFHGRVVKVDKVGPAKENRPPVR